MCSLTLLWAGDRPKMVDQMGFTSNCITPQVHTVEKWYLRVLIFMIWQWTGKSLVAMRAVQQGLLVGWICHTFDVKMSFSPKNWTSQIKHCTMTSNFWFWETVPAWYVKICLKNTSHHLFLYFLHFWVHFTYVHCDQPKIVDLPNIPHTINSWQFLKGKKTTYWMYFGLYMYIRWKFRKH